MKLTRIIACALALATAGSVWANPAADAAPEIARIKDVMQHGHDRDIFINAQKSLLVKVSHEIAQKMKTAKTQKERDELNAQSERISAMNTRLDAIKAAYEKADATAKDAMVDEVHSIMQTTNKAPKSHL